MLLLLRIPTNAGSCQFPSGSVGFRSYSSNSSGSCQFSSGSVGFRIDGSGYVTVCHVTNVSPQRWLPRRYAIREATELAIQLLMALL